MKKFTKSKESFIHYFLASFCMYLSGRLYID